MSHRNCPRHKHQSKKYLEQVLPNPLDLCFAKERPCVGSKTGPKTVCRYVYDKTIRMEHANHRPPDVSHSLAEDHCPHDRPPLKTDRSPAGLAGGVPGWQLLSMVSLVHVGHQHIKLPFLHCDSRHLSGSNRVDRELAAKFWRSIK